MTARSDAPPFHRIGPAEPASPVVLSVPHAGRAYSDALLRAARVPLNVLEALEDRHVDRLVWRAVADGAIALIADVPRAEIDLNRDERELDPAMVVPAPPAGTLLSTARTRGGLGLVPSRLLGAGGLWRGKMSREELERRVRTVHRPYHQALAELLAATRRRFGTAVLLDCHSMPSRQGSAQPAIVLGDRYGTSADPHVVRAAVDTVRGFGLEVTINDPYAGGYVVERHGQPAEGVHAMQIEVDRGLYLDDGLKDAGEQFDLAARLIAAIAEACGEAVRRDALPVAAE